MCPLRRCDAAMAAAAVSCKKSHLDPKKDAVSLRTNQRFHLDLLDTFLGGGNRERKTKPQKSHSSFLPVFSDTMDGRTADFLIGGA